MERPSGTEHGAIQGRALVRRPSPRLHEGIVTHLDRQPVDFDRAYHQWERYVSTLAENGWDIVEVPPRDECPDGVFVEDTVVMHGDVAVICRPGAEARRAELESTAATLDRLGYALHHLGEPATLDGGDVLKVAPLGPSGPGSETIYVGRSGRTNTAGVEQLRAVVERRGATVVAVPVTTVLHLKSAVTALPDGTIIGADDLVDDPALFPTYLPVPEKAGAHVVDLGCHRLLVSAAAPRTAAVLARRGYEPVSVDITEFEKLEGCVTCLSVRLRYRPRGR